MHSTTVSGKHFKQHTQFKFIVKKELVANVERPIIFQRENFENSIKPEIKEEKEEKEESKGFAGLFKKMHKDQNENDEDKNNTLKEIYEFRNF